MAKANRATFSGFSRDLIPFLEALGRNNSKPWFEAHRAEYDALYLEPAKAFCEALAGPLSKVERGVRCEPRVNGSIMRINRDTRFSKDKTPYRTGLYFIFALGEGPMRASPSFYLHLGPDGVGIAGGLFAFDPDQLARYRAAVTDARLGRALRRAVDTVKAAGPYELPEPGYKRVPRGFDPDHANCDYLRQKGLYASADLPAPKELFGARAVPWLVDRFAELRPLPRWLVRALA